MGAVRLGGWDRALNWLLAASLSTASFTRFRVRGGFGPGEAALLGWCMLAGGTWLSRRIRARAALEMPAVAMWLCFLSLNFSLLLGLLKGSGQPGSSHLTGLLSITFGMLVPGVFLSLTPVLPRLCHLRVCWLWAAGLTFSLLGLAVFLTGYAPLLLLNGVRFRGLCANPNQTALYLLMLPLLASQSDLKRPLKFLVVSSLLFLGFFTGSDALVLAWMSASLLIGFGSLKGDGESRRLGVFAACFIGMLACWFLFGRGTGGADFVGHESARENVGTRWTLIQNGLKAFSQSWVVGWGPGAFSGETAPFQSFEAHNSFVDLLASSGILGGLVYLTFWAWLWFGYHRGSAAGKSMLAAILVFSSFHVVYRHPLFWLSLFLTGSPMASGLFGKVDGLTPEQQLATGSADPVL